MNEDRVSRFLNRIAHFGAMRTHTPDYRLRDRLLAQFAAEIPACSPQEHERIKTAINAACGMGE